MLELNVSEFWKKIRNFEEYPIIVECNQIGLLLGVVLEAVDAYEIRAEVFYQPNLDFPGDLVSSDPKFVNVDYEQLFKDYCNYYDKNRIGHIFTINKKLCNYSRKGKEELVLPDYPQYSNMILVVDNWNFYDFVSQVHIAELMKRTSGISVIMQLRTNPEWARDHISLDIKDGAGRFSWVRLINESSSYLDF
jgi:hypothetical protein